MDIQFCGGARTVTGSQYLIRVNNQQILLECGLYQGRRAEAHEINQRFLFEPSQVDAVILSHAHIDHSGNIPSLVKAGFDGPIYATAATADLCQIMLRDSAFLQEKDAEFANKIHRRKGEPENAKALYTIDEAEAAMHCFHGVQYERPIRVAPGVRATLRDAGHILGSAGIVLDVEEEGRPPVRLGFSGDVGRAEVPVLRDPDALRDLDYLILESTYGGRRHGPREDVEGELAETIGAVARRGGKVIIPAFAVGRTQLLVYHLHKLFVQNRIPDIPIFVDSPLARAATEVFRVHPECFDRETWQDFLTDGQDPFGFARLAYTHTVEDSKALNRLTKPHIIISASGMAEGGRILHHLRNNIDDHRNLVLLVGHAAEHTLARRLMDGDEEVRIFGESHRVRCQVKRMDAFSGHADRDELLAYVGLNPPARLRKVFLVHGEPEQAEALQAGLLEAGCSDVSVPERGQTASL